MTNRKKFFCFYYVSIFFIFSPTNDKLFRVRANFFSIRKSFSFLQKDIIARRDKNETTLGKDK